MLVERLGQVDGVGEVVAGNGVGVLAVDGAGAEAGVRVDLDLGKLIGDRIEAGWKTKG